VPRDGLRRQNPQGKTAMFGGGFAQKTYTNCLNPIAKNPAIWYNKKGWRTLSFYEEIYIPFFREEKNYG
jgi:hypothetical protein